MKEKVADISEALKEMACEMRSMRETIDAQQTEIHALNRNLEGLRSVTQEVDLPVFSPVITEHRHYMKRCACGCRNKGYAPRKRGSQVTFGSYFIGFFMGKIKKETRRNETYPLGHIAGGAYRLRRNGSQSSKRHL